MRAISVSNLLALLAREQDCLASLGTAQRAAKASEVLRSARGRAAIRELLHLLRTHAKLFTTRQGSVAASVLGKSMLSRNADTRLKAAIALLKAALPADEVDEDKETPASGLASLKGLDAEMLRRVMARCAKEVQKERRAAERTARLTHQDAKNAEEFTTNDTNAH